MMYLYKLYMYAWFVSFLIITYACCNIVCVCMFCTPVLGYNVMSAKRMKRSLMILIRVAYFIFRCLFSEERCKFIDEFPRHFPEVFHNFHGLNTALWDHSYGEFLWAGNSSAVLYMFVFDCPRWCKCMGFLSDMPAICQAQLCAEPGARM